MNDTTTPPAGAFTFVSPRELSQLLRVSVDCIYRLAARRILPCYRVLRRVLFRRDDVDRWLAERRTDSRPPTVWR